jgi:hypothetical protein
VALGQVFSQCFGFPCQFSFHRLLHIHHHLSSGAGTIGPISGRRTKWTQVSLNPKKLKKKSQANLSGLLLYPKDGLDMFLRTTRRYNPETRTLRYKHCSLRYTQAQCCHLCCSSSDPDGAFSLQDNIAIAHGNIRGGPMQHNQKPRTYRKHAVA